MSIYLDKLANVQVIINCPYSVAPKWWSELPNYPATWHLNSKPFHKRTIPHDLNTELVRYSDPHSIYIASYVYCMLNKIWYSYLIFLWKQDTLYSWVWTQRLDGNLASTWLLPINMSKHTNTFEQNKLEIPQMNTKE